MKKFLIAFIAILIFLFSNEIKAQQSNGELVISPGIGYSLISESIPPLYFNADFGVDEMFSLGGSISYSNVSYRLLFGDQISESRTNVAMRALFHFGDNPKLDHYMGSRLGLIIRNSDVKFNEADFGWRVLYGMRAYLSDNVGVNLEVGIGQPYFFNGGVVFRIK